MALNSSEYYVKKFKKKVILQNVNYRDFNPIEDGLFRCCSRIGGIFDSSLPKIFHTYPTMMKLELYLTQGRPKKYVNHVAHLLSSAGISIFSSEISKFCYINKYRYRLDFDTYYIILLIFPEPGIIALINMVTSLIMSAKMATPGLLKIKVF